MSTGTPESIFDPQPVRHVAGFWRRFFAFLIDSVLVGIAAHLIAIPFFDLLADLGPVGRLAGFLIGLVYFAVPESSIGSGQSLGKRILGLRVVNAEGNPLSVEDSALRYMVFAVPWLLNGLALPISSTPWIVTFLISVAVFGLGSATLYLLVFNRSTRQGLHDLATKSYVVEASQDGPVAARPMWKFHWMVAGALFLVLGTGPAAISHNVMRGGPFPELLDDVRVLEQMNGVQQARALKTWERKIDSEGRKTSLTFTVLQMGTQPDEEAFADDVARAVLQNDPKAMGYDLLRINIIRGYDLGIAHAERTWSFSHAPAEWHELLSTNSR